MDFAIVAPVRSGWQFCAGQELPALVFVAIHADLASGHCATLAVSRYTMRLGHFSGRQITPAHLGDGVGTLGARDACGVQVGLGLRHRVSGWLVKQFDLVRVNLLHLARVALGYLCLRLFHSEHITAGVRALLGRYWRCKRLRF